MKPLRKVVYSIGSNLGDRLSTYRCRRCLSDTPDVIVVDVSSVYETRPVGGPPESPLFLNIVWSRRPHSNQEPGGAGIAIEDAYGRARDSERWGPRTLDVDLIMVGNAVVDQEDLKLRIRWRTSAPSSWCRGTRSTRPGRLQARAPLATCSARRTPRAWSGEMIL